MVRQLPMPPMVTGTARPQGGSILSRIDGYRWAINPCSRLKVLGVAPSTEDIVLRTKSPRA